jgi:death-on-curing protein
VFLQLNGYELVAEETDAVINIVALAAGEMTENDLAQWIEINSTRLRT